MTNVEMNNEIVLLRKSVRQARICVINKLIREAKTLSNKQGPEKLVEKYKKRADKLLREVYAVRVIKDDEISKFGIANFDRLQDIIQNPTTNDRTRAIAKVVKFKFLNSRIAEFKEKYPNCEEVLELKKKKKKITAKQKTAASVDTEWEPTKKLKADDVNSVVTVKAPIRKSSPRVCKQRKTEVQVVDEGGLESSSDEGEGSSNQTHSKKKSKSSDSKVVGTPRLARYSPSKSVKVISEQATVKRFTEILKETNEGRSESTDVETNANTNTNTNTETPDSTAGPSNVTATTSRTEDDFFLSVDENAANTKILGSWKRTSAALPETSGVSGPPRFKRGKGVLNDKSWNAGRKQAKPSKGESNNGSRKEEGSRGTKLKKAAVGFQKKGARQRAETTATQDDANLHPSWAARKKQQEIMKQGFQGKKIVFDDN